MALYWKAIWLFVRVDGGLIQNMFIPYNELSEEVLQALIEDFVTRDGTDYGWDEMSTQDKAAHLLESLKKGEMLISYNEESQSCGLVNKEEVSKKKTDHE